MIAEERLRTTPDALRRHFAGREPLPVVMEVGTHSPWVSRLVGQLGHQVFVANASKVRLIYANDSKTDKVDPITLARVGRLDPQLLSPVRHRGEAAQVELARLRARDCLVRARLPSTSTPAFARNAAPHIPEALQPALQPLLDTIETLSQQIQGAERELEAPALERYPETDRRRPLGQRRRLRTAAPGDTSVDRINRIPHAG